MSGIERYIGINVFVINSRPIGTLPPPAEPLDPNVEVRIIKKEELHTFAQDKRLDMRPDFIDEAIDRGDKCFGYLENDSLVAYVWLGLSESRMEAGFNVRIGEGYSYSYKSFTLPSHRGRRLQQQITWESDGWRQDNGFKYNIDYVRTHNFASIAADRRYGNVAVGYAGYIRRFGFVMPFRSPGTKHHKFELVRRQ